MLRIGTKGWGCWLALRQLGGVRRGIEIANAHYGYFPIEGRIPLSWSLTKLLALSHPIRFSLALSISASRLRTLAWALFHSLRSAPYTHQFALVLSLPHRISFSFIVALSHHIFAYPPRDLLFPLSRSPFVAISFFFLSFFLSLSFSSPFLETECMLEIVVHISSCPTPAYLRFSLRTWIIFSPRSIATPNDRFRDKFFFLDSFLSQFLQYWSHFVPFCAYRARNHHLSLFIDNIW